MQRRLESLLVFATGLVAAIVPLVLLPTEKTSSYPLIWIYLVPKNIVLKASVMILIAFAVLLLLFRFGSALRKKVFRIYISYADLFFILFFIFLWFSSINSLNKEHAFFGSIFWQEGFYTYRDYLVLFLVASVFGHSKSLISISYILMPTTIAISIYAIIEAFFPGIQSFTNVGLIGRSGATTGNAVILGAYLTMPILIFLTLLVRNVYGRRSSFIALGSLILAVLALVFTFSRGSWLAILIVSVVVVGWSWQRRPRISKRFIALSVVILLFIAIMISLGPRPPQNVVARAFSAFNPSEPTVETRLVAWRQAFRVIAAFPVWGTGIDSFSFGVASLSPKSTDGVLDKPHNFFLEALATMGILAFLAYLSALAIIFYSGWKMVRQAKPNYQIEAAGMAASGAYLLALFFLFSTINNAPLFYVILGLTAAGARETGTLPIFKLADFRWGSDKQMGQAS